MSGSKNQQIEFEVFPKDNKTNYSYLSEIQSDTAKQTTQINVVFSHQSVIIIFICLVMLLVASFALGVEKGKLVARNSIMEPQEKAITETAVPVVSKEETAEINQQNPVQEKIAAQLPADSAGESVNKSPNITGGYTIQVASLKSEASAKGLAEKLTQKGITSFTKTSGKYTIVLAGNFAKREDAQQSLRELKKTYSDSFIRNN